CYALHQHLLSYYVIQNDEAILRLAPLTSSCDQIIDD
ncbi:MAG: hypothetical protein ACI8RD_004861, partial [Bacillariaceae sp.]